MRFLIINLLATALLFVGASTAGAFALSSASPDTVPTELTIGDQITVTVTLDTEGEASLTLLSAGLLFNPDILSYNPGATRTSSYLLFVSGKGATANMTPAFDPPAIRFGTTDQINLDFVSSSLTSGSGATGIAYWDGGASSGPDGTVQQMIILAFDVIGNGATAVALSVTAAGNIVQLAGGIDTTASLSPDLNYQVPEPGIASLSLAALLTLGALRSRNRRAQ